MGLVGAVTVWGGAGDSAGKPFPPRRSVHHGGGLAKARLSLSDPTAGRKLDGARELIAAARLKWAQFLTPNAGPAGHPQDHKHQKHEYRRHDRNRDVGRPPRCDVFVRRRASATRGVHVGRGRSVPQGAAVRRGGATRPAAGRSFPRLHGSPLDADEAPQPQHQPTPSGSSRLLSPAERIVKLLIRLSCRLAELPPGAEGCCSAGRTSAHQVGGP